MTLAPETDSWTLTELANGQLEACGIALSELYRLMHRPSMTIPGLEPGETRINGYGLTVIVAGRQIRSIEIDGASAENWSGWARERAAFGDSDVAAADQLVRDAAKLLPRKAFIPKARKKKAEEVPVVKQHILDRVHPKLRRDITRLVAGDFSRLVIHSSTKVTINPPR